MQHFTPFRLTRVTGSGETRTDKTTTSLAVGLSPQGSSAPSGTFLWRILTEFADLRLVGRPWLFRPEGCRIWQRYRGVSNCTGRRCDMKEAFIFYTLNLFSQDAQYQSLVSSPWLSHILSVCVLNWRWNPLENLFRSSPDLLTNITRFVRNLKA